MSRVKFQGLVTRTFAKGFDVTESRKAQDGREFKQRFTVWTDEPVAEGATVTVEGLLSLSVEEWKGRDGDTRHSVKASVNKPTVTVAEDAAPEPHQSWAAGESTPF